MKTFKFEGGEFASIDPKLIVIGERFRKDYGDLTDLIHSIKTRGLINPISVTERPDGSFSLIAGGRRLQAVTHLEWAEVPVRLFAKDLSELELRILELAENLQRKDMSWQETAQLQREIHLLQQQKHGKPAPGPNQIGGWKVEDTASMLGVSPATVSNSIALVDNIDRFGSVVDFSKVKTAKEAASKIGMIQEAVLRTELVKRAEKNKEKGSFIQTLTDAYVIGDAIEGMKAMEDASFDFIMLDPPFGIDLDKNKQSSQLHLDSYNEVQQFQYSQFMHDVLTQTYRLQKPHTFCVLWFGMEPWFDMLYKQAVAIGYDLTRVIGVWIKPNGQTLNPSTHLATAFESFFLLRKGSPVLAKPGRTNVFQYVPVAPQRKYHPTQKPIELAVEILQTFSFENAKVLVPFLGSGVDIIAGAQTRRYVTGFDLAEEFKGGFIQEVQSTFGGVPS